MSTCLYLPAGHVSHPAAPRRILGGAAYATLGRQRVSFKRVVPKVHSQKEALSGLVLRVFIGNSTGLRIVMARQLSEYEVANGNGIGKQYCDRVLCKQTKRFEATPAEDPPSRRYARNVAAQSIPKACSVRLCCVRFLHRECPMGTHLQ
jgi:hypothetical protein